MSGGDPILPDVQHGRPTMKDVAALAGVGLKTVSRVVNGEPNVSKEMERRVREAIEALGFRKNDTAAMLRQRLSSSIGLVIEDVSEPFQSTLTRAVEQVALNRGSLLFIGSSAGDPRHEREVAMAFAARRVDGLIVIPGPADHQYLKAEIRAGMKVVFVDRPATGIEADVVLSDNVGGSALGTRHLISHGHTRIGFIGDSPDLFTTRERYLGYRQALEQVGIPLDPGLVSFGGVERAQVEAGLRQVLSNPEPATALFTSNSLITMNALRLLKGRIRQPAIVAHDDFELSDLLNPGITVIAQYPHDMGTQAAELVFRRLAGDDSPHLQIRLNTQLIQRGSGEIAP